jgi:hypothetical protein
LQAANWLGIEELDAEINAGSHQEGSLGTKSRSAFGGLGFNYKLPRQENYFKIESKLRSKLRSSGKNTKDDLQGMKKLKGSSSFPPKVGHNDNDQDSEEDEGKAQRFIITKKLSTKQLSKSELLRPGKRKKR